MVAQSAMRRLLDQELDGSIPVCFMANLRLPKFRIIESKFQLAFRVEALKTSLLLCVIPMTLIIRRNIFFKFLKVQ